MGKAMRLGRHAARFLLVAWSVAVGVAAFAVAVRAADAPGSLISAEPMRGALMGARAYRVLYNSVGLNGETIPVSGVVIVPRGPTASGGRPVVAWAHPTTGIVRSCAPSLTPTR